MTKVKEPLFIRELKAECTSNGYLKFICDIPVPTTGVFDYAFRMFPKHPELPYRQDFNLIKWL